MSRMDSGTAIRGKARPNIYSVLAIVATVALLVGVGVVWKSNLELTKVDAQYGGQDTGMNPLFIMEQK